MNLTGALSIANGGIANINAQLALISQNVANASTPAYAVEEGTQQSVIGEGIGLGVQTGPARRQVNQALDESLRQQNSGVAGLSTRKTALQAIDAVLGSVGSRNDLGGLLSALQGKFSTLLTDPSSQTAQTSAVAAAGTLAAGINNLSAAYTQQRQTAQASLMSDVNTLNQTLATIGQLSDKIVAETPSGHGTADLENQRAAAVQTLSKLLSIKTIQQPNGDMMIFTTAGTMLPTRGSAAPFSLTGGSTQSGSYYPGGGLPGIMLDGQDVTAGMEGGQIGANLTLRDKTLPTDQAELDEFAYALSSRFAAQGLTLFTDPSGGLPAGGGAPTQNAYIGYAASIQINPAVQASPSLARDGTDAIAGSSTGASAFTPNPSDGPAGFSTLIDRVLNFAFGSEAQPGVQQPAFASTGLGPSGTLTAKFSGDRTLGGYAASLTATQSAESGDASSRLATEASVQTTLQTQVNTISGVSIDVEMSKMIALQNAYSANARVISIAQGMFNEILQATQ